MIVETKANVGHMIWFMNNNVACNYQVQRISITVNAKQSTIDYTVWVSSSTFNIVVRDSDVFLSKEALLKSL